MNYFFYIIAVAAFVALGSPFPVLESAYAQNTVNQCTGTPASLSDAQCIQQGCQQNQGNGNTQTNTFKDGDMNTTNTEECQIGSGSGNTQTNTFD